MILIETHYRDEFIERPWGALQDEIHPDIKIWAADNLRGPISFNYSKYIKSGYEVIEFQFWYETDAMLFKLTWL